MNESRDNPNNDLFDPEAAIRLNRERLRRKFDDADRNRLRWLVECRDLGDAFDADAGVFFVECPDDAAVEQLAARFTDDNAYNRILGIFDLRKPLDEQRVGMTREEWLNRAKPEID